MYSSGRAGREEGAVICLQTLTFSLVTAKVWGYVMCYFEIQASG